MISDLRDLYKELQKAHSDIINPWIIQNNKDDFSSNFIYKTAVYDEVIKKIQENNLNRSYVIHRWYNFHTSISCEKIMIGYGCLPETDKKNKQIDLYFKGVPYDVKLTVYPKKFEKGVNINNREGKDKLIRWLYENQSQQGRKHYANRLFIVCNSKTGKYNESLKLKANFSLLDKKIKAFMDFYSNKNLNLLDIFDKNRKYRVYSDIISIEEE